MTSRTRVRAGAALAAAAVLSLVPVASAAASSMSDAGEEPGEGLTALQTILIFVGGPLLITIVITLLVYAPGWARSGRYRPSDGWSAEPVLFGSDATSAVPAAPAQDDAQGGGASARW